ncbi:cyclin-H-like isoform X3 [Gigantopelta aegis]|uniref:cyclin-H-like isoform X3 n=1 Tax=Gigantopelta aegis TaxID=1735272 RepID=UPI001B88C657|nr:cyclin-H-like isoform X3 [Gigantopelta aegis]
MMFAVSTQRQFWTFRDEQEVEKQRRETNEKYIHSMEEEQRHHFLTSSEELSLCRYFEFIIKEFCAKFQPPMPKCVLGTSLIFFKRFYLNNSMMDYHPRDMMLTCVYLACKVEEFYVPIGQFVGNLKSNREKFADVILGFELLLMQKLHYHLTIHNPFRPMEGLLIDLKTRCRSIGDPERLRKSAEDFVDRSFVCDVLLIYAPSQIALAAILSSAAKEGISLDSYISQTLMSGGTEDDVKRTMYQLNKLIQMVKNQQMQPKEVTQQIQKKLEKCRNQENNPDSEVYKRKMEAMLDDDDEIQASKRAKYIEDRRKEEQDLVS